MKKIPAIGLLLFIFVYTCEAQKVYSLEQLEQASLENLELYLGKAQGLKKTGAILSIAGSAAAITGLILAGAGESTFPVGFGMLLAGTGVTLVGVPVLLTGSSRVKRIKSVINSTQGKASIELGPSSYYNYDTNKLQLGMRLCMKF